jgi:GH18 family chitinase
MTLSVPTYGYRYEGVNRLTKSTRSAFISHAYNPFKALASVAADKCAIDVRGRVTFAELVSEGVSRPALAWSTLKPTTPQKVHANGLKGRGSYIRYFDTCTSTPFLFSPKDKTFVAYDECATLSLALAAS